MNSSKQFGALLLVAALFVQTASPFGTVILNGAKAIGQAVGPKVANLVKTPEGIFGLCGTGAATTVAAKLYHDGKVAAVETAKQAAEAVKQEAAKQAAENLAIQNLQQAHVDAAANVAKSGWLKSAGNGVLNAGKSVADYTVVPVYNGLKSVANFGLNQAGKGVTLATTYPKTAIGLGVGVAAVTTAGVIGYKKFFGGKKKLALEQDQTPLNIAKLVQKGKYAEAIKAVEKSTMSQADKNAHIAAIKTQMPAQKQDNKPGKLQHSKWFGRGDREIVGANWKNVDKPADIKAQEKAELAAMKAEALAQDILKAANNAKTLDDADKVYKLAGKIADDNIRTRVQKVIGVPNNFGANNKTLKSAIKSKNKQWISSKISLLEEILNLQ